MLLLGVQFEALLPSFSDNFDRDVDESLHLLQKLIKGLNMLNLGVLEQSL